MSFVPMTYNARIKDIAPNGVVSEQVAENVAFHYDAVSTKAYFTFNSRPFVYVNGDPEAFAGTSTDTLDSQADAVITRCFGVGLKDPVTQQDLGTVSVAGLELLIKQAYDTLYNERATANGYPTPDVPYPSAQAIAQANGLIDLYGSGENGYPLGKAFGGPGITATTPTPSP